MSLNRPFFFVICHILFGDIYFQRNFLSAFIFAYLCRSGVLDDERPTGIGVYISVVLLLGQNNRYFTNVNRFSPVLFG